MNLAKMEGIIERGYDLNIVSLLYMLKGGESIDSKNLKIQAFKQMMERKGLILDGVVSLAGEELLKFLEEGTEPTKEIEKVQGLEELYDRVVERLIALTGKKQMRVEIYGKTYNYLPNKYDFTTRLKKTINKYKLNDTEKLEKVIIRNIENCHKKNKWYPLLMYYFTKDDVSTLATDYEAWEESKQIIEQDYDGTNI